MEQTDWKQLSARREQGDKGRINLFPVFEFSQKGMLKDKPVEVDEEDKMSAEGTSVEESVEDSGDEETKAGVWADGESNVKERYNGDLSESRSYNETDEDSVEDFKPEGEDVEDASDSDEKGHCDFCCCDWVILAKELRELTMEQEEADDEEAWRAEEERESRKKEGTGVVSPELSGEAERGMDLQGDREPEEEEKIKEVSVEEAGDMTLE